MLPSHVVRYLCIQIYFFLTNYSVYQFSIGYSKIHISIHLEHRAVVVLIDGYVLSELDLELE